MTIWANGAVEHCATDSDRSKNMRFKASQTQHCELGC